MFPRRLISLAVAATMALAPIGSIASDAGHALLGGVVGGVIGGVIVNEANKNRPPRRTTNTVVVHPRADTATRAANRETQSALNYFGYAAGPADGIMGRKSRAAISQYQGFMGYPVTGELTSFQRDVLVGAYQRGLAGSYETVQLVSTDPLGSRALLVAQRNILTGVPATPAPGAGTTAVMASETAPVQESGALPLLPVLAADVSLASHCSKVSLVTNSNGGFTNVAAMTDPVLVLNEQFCLARAYAMDAGEQMVKALSGVTQAQADNQCAQYGAALKDHVASLSFDGRETVLNSVDDFIRESGSGGAQLASTAKICLSSGYRKDDMDVALGSALLLVALNDAPYGELIGHHLAQGFGTAQRVDLALDWFDAALIALDSGTPAVFAPAQSDRTELLEAAVYQLGGNEGLPVRSTATTAPKALPTLSGTSGSGKAASN